MIDPDNLAAKIPLTLRECTHIDEVICYVVLTKGLTEAAAEIGVATGRGTIPLLKKFKKVYVVDLWPHSEDDYEECMNNLKEYQDKLVVLRGLSWEMVEQIPDDSLDLFYLDTDHQYETTVKELLVLYPKLRSGGVASGHDYSGQFPGLVQAVDEFVVSIGSPYLNTNLGKSKSWAFEKE